MPNSWGELEIYYAQKIRQSSRNERKRLYIEAYAAVGEKGFPLLPDAPEMRTAGTSISLVNSLIHICNSSDQILEVGCGRGFTCWKLAKHVKHITGIDVSDLCLAEAKDLLMKNHVFNVTLRNGFADELVQYFSENQFDKVISIDVYEHLHPEDGKEHLRQVYSILKRKGRYIICTPNRLTGPHDVTKEIYPDAKYPLGFHLNETTCKELIGNLKEVGFNKFYSVFPLANKLYLPFEIIYPSSIFIMFERYLERANAESSITRLAGKASEIVLIAEKD